LVAKSWVHHELRDPPYSITMIFPLTHETVSNLATVWCHSSRQRIVRALRQAFSPQPGYVHFDIVPCQLQRKLFQISAYVPGTAHGPVI
jgi:hypothetical protein